MMIKKKCKKRNRANRRGAALLIVLIVVMFITILSLGFLSRSDVELACGRNMTLRTEMDYLVESGLVHARGLILNPQDCDSEYWTGAEALQLVDNSSDYYDLTVNRSDPNSGQTYRCNYEITSSAYRLKGGEDVGRSSLKAELRLDPCIAYWAGATWRSELQTTVNGDVYCNGNLEGEAHVNGDIFATGTITELYVQGRKNEAVTQPPVIWPGLDINDFSPTYYVGSTSYPAQSIIPGTYTNCTFGSALSEPPEIFYCSGDIELAGGVTINGMLVVDHNLMISDANNGIVNVITAGKNFPALLVGGEVVVENSARLEVNGLVQISQRIYVNPAAENVNIDVVGGLFIANGDIDGLNDSPLMNSITITAAPAIASIQTWPEPDVARRWSQAAGAFFRSIERN